jgi:hypothetical protein
MTNWMDEFKALMKELALYSFSFKITFQKYNPKGTPSPTLAFFFIVACSYMIFFHITEKMWIDNIGLVQAQA